MPFLGLGEEKKRKSHITFQLHTLSWVGGKATSHFSYIPFLGLGKKPHHFQLHTLSRVGGKNHITFQLNTLSWVRQKKKKKKKPHHFSVTYPFLGWGKKKKSTLLFSFLGWGKRKEKKKPHDFSVTYPFLGCGGGGGGRNPDPFPLHTLSRVGQKSFTLDL